MSSERVEYIDIAKGIGILLVAVSPDLDPVGILTLGRGCGLGGFHFWFDRWLCLDFFLWDFIFSCFFVGFKLLADRISGFFFKQLACCDTELVFARPVGQRSYAAEPCSQGQGSIVREPGEEAVRSHRPPSGVRRAAPLIPSYIVDVPAERQREDPGIRAGESRRTTGGDTSVLRWSPPLSESSSRGTAPRVSRGDTLYCASGGRVFALEPDTGEIMWRYTGKRIANITASIGNGKIFFEHIPKGFCWLLTAYSHGSGGETCPEISRNGGRRSMHSRAPRLS